MRALTISVLLLLGACAADTPKPGEIDCRGQEGVYTTAGTCHGDDTALPGAELPPCVPSESAPESHPESHGAPCRAGSDTAAGAPEPKGPAEIGDEAVRAAQMMLDSLGIDPGGASGVLDSRTEGAIRSFQIRMGLPEDGRISADLLRSLRQAVTTVAALPGKPPAPPAAPNQAPKRQWTGSGFVVSRDGHVITNRHVVDGCASILAGAAKTLVKADVVATDELNDLALVRIPNWQGETALFRESANIRPGDEIVVLGYPLSDILATEAHVTTGTVSALAGLRNDIRFLQISAPVQPGNSGGPVLDRQGRIIAIVASKLDSVKMTDSTSRTLQNVNFAIRSSLARAFLDANGIKYAVAEGGTDKSTADIGELARPVTVRIECWR